MRRIAGSCAEPDAQLRHGLPDRYAAGEPALRRPGQELLPARRAIHRVPHGPGRAWCSPATQAAARVRLQHPLPALRAALRLRLQPQAGLALGRRAIDLSIRGGFGIYFNRSEEELSLQDLGAVPFALNSNGIGRYRRQSVVRQSVGRHQDRPDRWPTSSPSRPPTKGSTVDFSQVLPALDQRDRSALHVALCDELQPEHPARAARGDDPAGGLCGFAGPPPGADV